MTISVLMSTYRNDDPEHLNIALRSIYVKQVEKPDEIVLVKDGPLTPELDAVIDRWRVEIGEHFKVISQEKNLGLPKSLNNGLSHCSGDYIARMDADDISLPERFLELKKFLKDNPEIVVLGASIEEFDEEGGGTFIRHFPKNTEKVFTNIPKGSPFNHPSVIVKKEIFKDFKYNENLTSSKNKIVSSNEDIDLWFRILKAGYEVANLDKVLLRYRKNKTFYLRRSRDKAIAEFKVYWKGTLKLHGISIHLIFPVLRLISRAMPVPINKLLYSSRSMLFKKQ